MYLKEYYEILKKKEKKKIMNFMMRLFNSLSHMLFLSYKVTLLYNFLLF